MKKIISIVSAFTLLLVAIPVFAQTPTNFKEVIENTIIGGILKPLIPLLIGLAVVMFIYGVLILIFSEGGEKKEDGKKYMIWGIIGIFVMVSVWGLVAILQNTFNLENVAPQNIRLNVPGTIQDMDAGTYNDGIQS